MQNQIQHYRVEFYGGPNDGHIEYFKEKPKEEFQLISKFQDVITNQYKVYIYLYVLNWINDHQAKYIYKDFYILEAE